MRFRNKRNGAVIEMPDTFSGKFWEPVKAPGTAAPAQEKQAKAAKKPAAAKPAATRKK